MSRGVTRGVLTLALLVVAACSNPAGGRPRARWADLGRPCPRSAQAYSLPSELKATLRPDDMRSTNARRAEFARQMPGGWGGHFYADGQHAIYLKDLSQRDTVLTALAHLFDYGKEVRVLQGRWDLAQLYDWEGYLVDPILGMKGVSGGGIDEAQNRIVYSVDDGAVYRRASEKLARIGVPCFLVALEIVEPMRGF